MAQSNKKPKKRVSKVEEAEISAVKALAPALRHPAVRIAGKVGELGDQPPLRMLSLTLLAAGLWRGKRRLAEAGARMIVAHQLATFLKSRGKDMVDRTRPEAVIDGDGYRMEPGHSDEERLQGFPSGHMAGAVAVARAAAREYPENRVGFYGLATLIGALQIPRRAHFPTDVLAGALVGLAAEGAVHAATEWARRRATTAEPGPLPALA